MTMIEPLYILTQELLLFQSWCYFVGGRPAIRTDPSVRTGPPMSRPDCPSHPNLPVRTFRTGFGPASDQVRTSNPGFGRRTRPVMQGVPIIIIIIKPRFRTPWFSPSVRDSCQARGVSGLPCCSVPNAAAVAPSPRSGSGTAKYSAARDVPLLQRAG